MKSSKSLRGWIQPCDPETTEAQARAELTGIGVKVGEWDLRLREFQKCEVSEGAFEKLESLWGRYVWGLE